MKYILKGDNDCLNPIQTVLKNRNITEDLFSLTEDVIEDYNNYDNMDKGILILLKHINNKNKIVIIPDEDVDGATSAAILYNYIKMVFDYENLHYVMHTKKVHGLSEDIIIDEDTKLILLPDSSSNDYEQHKILKEKGIDIIVLDHHPSDHISDSAIIINNRLSKNVKNKNLAGVGVTYKFLKALDNYLFEDKADYFLDLVTLGCVADVIDLKEPETRCLCYRGMREINNTFLKALIEKNDFQLEGKYNITKLGWVLAPKLNGCIRSASQDVKEEMFKAFISDDYENALKVADKCKLAKESQDRAVKKILPVIEKDIIINNIDKCLILEAPKTLKSPHTGLVANKLQEKYGVPVLIYRKGNDEIFNGNARGNNNITKDFKSDLTNSKLFEWCQGQPNAFGWCIKSKNLANAKEYINKLYKNKEIIMGKTHEVDFILEEKDISYGMINELCQYENEWGNGIPEPLIMFKDLMIFIDENNIKGSKSKNLIFEVNGVKFIKKYLTNILKDELLEKGMVVIDCIGKCVNNIYEGKSYPQIEVIEIEIKG